MVCGGLAAEALGWLGGVNPLRRLGEEFATNCVLTSIAVDMALAEGEGFRAGAAGPLAVDGTSGGMRGVRWWRWTGSPRWCRRGGKRSAAGAAVLAGGGQQSALDQLPGELLGTAPVPAATQSGFYRPGPANGDARALDEMAAAWFPPVAGAVLWHLHFDPVTGHVLAGDRALTPQQFYDQVMGACPWPETLLVIVGCGAAAAQALAGLGSGPVLAADTFTWTTQGRQVRRSRLGWTRKAGLLLGTTRGNWVPVPGLVSGGGWQPLGDGRAACSGCGTAQASPRVAQDG